MKLRKNKNKKLIKLAMKFQPWDFGFNLEAEREMLSKMYKFYSSYKPVAEGSERVAREVSIAIKLLDIVLENDHAVSISGTNGDYAYNLTKYVNIRNAKRFGRIPNLEKNMMKDHLRQIKAWYLYNKLRLYRMQTWWD